MVATARDTSGAARQVHHHEHAIKIRGEWIPGVIDPTGGERHRYFVGTAGERNGLYSINATGRQALLVHDNVTTATLSPERVGSPRRTKYESVLFWRSSTPGYADRSAGGVAAIDDRHGRVGMGEQASVNAIPAAPAPTTR